jgi:hypothetical protein
VLAPPSHPSSTQRTALDGFIKGDDDESAAFNFDTYEGLSDAEADAVIENDPDDDPYGVFDDLDLGEEDN